MIDRRTFSKEHLLNLTIKFRTDYQLLNISSLFYLVHDFESIKNNYIFVCSEEFKCRNLSITYEDCLLDSFNASLAIVSRCAYN